MINMINILLDEEETYQIKKAIENQILDCESGVFSSKDYPNMDTKIKHTLKNVLRQIKEKEGELNNG